MRKTILATSGLLLSTLLLAAPALAQEKEAAEPTLALDGYCAVCITKGEKWVKGDPEISHTFDGHVYLFPDTDARDAFAKSPEEFVPVLGGDCIVCYAEHGERSAGDIKFSSRHKGRVYLFPNDEIRQMFVANPEKYENADLAVDGKCVVCLVKAGHDVAGKTEFTAIHKGLRYLFPSDAERQAFLKSPEEFATEAAKLSANADMKDAELVNFTGTTSCAACNYGLHPINTPGDLGLAVKTATGDVYIIEGASKNYAQIYKDRFDELNVAVSGRVIEERDGVRWVEPTELKRM